VSAAPAAPSLFLTRVADLVTRPPVTCARSTSALEIARQLTREGVGSAVVVDEDGRAAGIVTDRDLRSKVVAQARDAATTSASAIMSAPVVTIPPAAFAFEALREMTRRDIHHLPVCEEGRVLGVLSSNDFVRLHTTHPVLLVREIAAAPSLEALAQLASRTTPLVRRLLDEGGSPYDIGQLVAEVNDRIVLRVLALTEAALDGRPPVPYTWLVFGSEARREQTLRTDQDNGLVYADPPAGQAEAVGAYYARLASEVVRGLLVAGFPRCPGDIMASNPKWCQPLSAWSASFRRWMGRPLAEDVRTEAPRSHVFLAHLARDVVAQRVPLTVFGNLATERAGSHRGGIDLKAAGSLQLVGAGRLAALERGVAETNTVDRLRAAGVYTASETQEMTDAYQHLLRLRLARQLSCLEAGAPPDNYVDPAHLSHADALLLRDALKTVTRVQDALRARFLTDRMMV
jgi:CBS domain-containing protein